ncbi:MAG: cardiolipin synthase B [Deltaproteobacteria bacterium]|nr:cardiolipin synthase B [Deltaproteobacteria bacterium]
MKWIAAASSLSLLTALVALNLTSGESEVTHEIPHLYAVGDPQFKRSMGALLGPDMVAGNQVTMLVNGDQIFPAMLAAIRAAKQTINFETYIYWSGEVGRAFSEALSERARAGVKIHVLLDWVGSGKADKSLIEAMSQAGAEVEKYHPLRWYSLSRINNRTHRKLLVVDGRVGFTGGVGIADLWSGNAEDPDHWRDTHYRLEGPAVAQMQSVFMDNWRKTRALVLHGPEYFPALSPAGDQLAQVFRSSARDGAETVRLMYLLSIAAAAKSIRMENAYFVPDELSRRMLVKARQRGVRVEIIVPGRHTDSQVVRQASRAQWGELLDAGVEIYEFQPTMMHCKVMVVDELWTTVGSTNFDNRSFHLNDEANLDILDAKFAAENLRQMDLDKARSRLVTRGDWSRRPWSMRVAEWLTDLLATQL